MENNMSKKCCMSQHLSGSKQRKSPTGSSSTRLCGVAAWGCYNSPETQTCSYENGEMRCKRTSSLCCAWNPRFCVKREALFWSRDLRTMLLHPYWHPATQSLPEARFPDIAPNAAFFFLAGDGTSSRRFTGHGYLGLGTLTQRWRGPQREPPGSHDIMESRWWWIYYHVYIKHKLYINDSIYM